MISLLRIGLRNGILTRPLLRNGILTRPLLRRTLGSTPPPKPQAALPAPLSDPSKHKNHPINRVPPPPPSSESPPPPIPKLHFYLCVFTRAYWHSKRYLLSPSFWKAYLMQNWKPLLILNTSIVLLWHYFLENFYSVSGSTGVSMLPTMYMSGEWIIISKLHKHGHNVRVGDVVCARHPVFANEWVTKRVIGMPGDFVLTGKEMKKVPKGHCWIEGDNLEWSRDSREFGPIPLGLVIGKVVWRILPMRRFGKIENLMEEIEESELGLL